MGRFVNNLSASELLNKLKTIDTSELGKEQYTASQILTLLKTVDGKGSGLDAHRLSGNARSIDANSWTVAGRDGTGGSRFNWLKDGSGRAFLRQIDIAAFPLGSVTETVTAFYNNGDSIAIGSNIAGSSIRAYGQFELFSSIGKIGTWKVVSSAGNGFLGSIQQAVLYTFKRVA